MLSRAVALVTGASGFIGSHLLDHLLAIGSTVRCVQHHSRIVSPHSRAIIVNPDLFDAGSLASAMEGVDIVFHLAGISAVNTAHSNPIDAFRVNTAGALNILEAARLSGVQTVVMLSTAHVYGRPLQLPVTESHPTAPGSFYAATKLAADVLAAGYNESFGSTVTVLRPFNVYGPRQSRVAVIPEIVEQALAGGPIHVQNLHPQRDFIYVADVVDAIIRTAETPAARGQEIILSSGMSVSIAHLVSCVSSLVLHTTTDFPKEFLRTDDRVFGDFSRARTLLGWTPHTDLIEGLTRTIQWKRDQLRAAT